jgi:LmbE family N-acetylglucosaminyl deacetylase
VETFLVEGIDPDDPFRSVDWVTEPGAGGRAELLEAQAARVSPGSAQPLQETTTMNEDEQKKEMPEAEGDPAAELDARLTKLEAAVAQIADSVAQIANATGLDSLLAQVPAPDAAKEAARSRLITQKGPHTLATVREAVQAEITRAAAILGRGTGVQGLGSNGGDGAETPDEATTTALREALERQGLSGVALDAAVRGR